MALRTWQEWRPAHQGLPVCWELVWGPFCCAGGEGRGAVREAAQDKEPL